jgi:hypothetical protein
MNFTSPLNEVKTLHGDPKKKIFPTHEKWKKTKKAQRNGNWRGVERGVAGFSVQNARN